MGDSGSPPDINVSNGTCYYTEHMQTKGNFIACGNVAFGHWPCCQAGGYVPQSGYHGTAGNTYLAGCTDAGFNARSCPWKSLLFHEQEWVAIQQCHPGSGNEDTVWGGCKVDANQTTCRTPAAIRTARRPPPEGCLGAPRLRQPAELRGGSIKWTSDFNPTATAAGVKPANATATSKSSPTPSISPPSASATTPPTATATSSSPAATATSSDDSGLTVGAKAGIGVGAAGGGAAHCSRDALGIASPAAEAKKE
ncbi:hypothetical protein PG990_003297 [Apiospora arundinis]